MTEAMNNSPGTTPDSPALSERPLDEEEGVSLLDILVVLVRSRKIIGWTTAAFVALGLVIAIFSPSEYTASAKVIRETAPESGGGLPGGLGLAALRGLGISISGGTVGLTADTYPDILRGRNVRMAVVQAPIFFPDLDTTMTLVDYYSQPPGAVGSVIKGLKAITIGLPRTIKRMFRDKKATPIFIDGTNELVYPSEEEEKAIKNVLGLLDVRVARSTGIMSVHVTTSDPLISAQLTNTFVEYMMQRVRTIYTQKNQENLEFIRDRFGEAHEGLEEAEEVLARFMDRNRDPQTARLLTEMERLQRQVTFKTQLYSDLQTQLTQAEIELQHREPVITLLEAPVPPLEPSGPRRKLIVFSALMLGLFFGTGFGTVKTYVDHLRRDQETNSKLQEIRDALNPFRSVRTKLQRLANPFRTFAKWGRRS